MQARLPVDPVGGPRPIGGVLRRVRQHMGLSLREVERRTGRTNAYLSQVERGVIRSPDPLVLVQLCELYGLDYPTLAGWAGLSASAYPRGDDPQAHASLSALLRVAADLGPDERAAVLRLAERLRHSTRT